MIFTINTVCLTVQAVQAVQVVQAVQTLQHHPLIQLLIQLRNSGCLIAYRSVSQKGWIGQTKRRLSSTLAKVASETNFESPKLAGHDARREKKV